MDDVTVARRHRFGEDRVTDVAADGPAPEQPWVDLALNRPGAAARAQALQRRRAAPVRTGLARLLGVHTEERAWRIGADGEEVVARSLARLGNRWRVLHAVPVGRRNADIDHVLIGPGGVFTINAKNHPRGKVWVRGDTLMVDGTRVPYVHKSRHEADRAGRLLTSAVGYPVDVTGVIAVMCDRLTIATRPDGVLVLGPRDLRRRLARLDPVLTPEQVAHLHDHARRSTTWRPSVR